MLVGAQQFEVGALAVDVDQEARDALERGERDGAAVDAREAATGGEISRVRISCPSSGSMPKLRQ